MSGAILTIGSLTLYKSALVIALGAAACFCLGYALYSAHGGFGPAFWLFAFADVVLSVLLTRFLHYYCHMEQYASFRRAMTDYSVGGYVLAGTVPAALGAAALVRAAGMTKNTARLLDCFAPGALLAAALIRLSALFNSTCRGKIAVRTPLLQHLPLASAVTSSSGAADYRFATFFIEFLLFGGAFCLALRFFYKRRRRAMKADQPRDGNAALFALLLFGAVELVMDSTRYDSSFLHFNGFVSLGQMAAAFCLLAPLIVWSVRSIRANARGPFHWKIWGLWFLALVVTGFSEYFVQRFGNLYLVCYPAMAAGVYFMARLSYRMYEGVCAKKKKQA